MARAPSLTRLRGEHLLVLLAISFATTIISLIPTPPNDLWWHIRVGQLISEQGRIPDTNLFAWTVPAEASFVYAAWLGELLLHWVYQLGGTPLLALARNTLALFLLGVVALESRRRSDSWRFTGVAVILAGFLLLTSVTVRTQMWAWVPFGLFVLLLGRYADRRLAPAWLVALPLLMVFWVNVHGSFVLGLVLIGGYLVGEFLGRLRGAAQALDWRDLSWLALAGLATAGATVINPRGLGIVTYVQELATNPSVRLLTNEWQPPSPSNLLHIPFYLSILLLLGAFARARRPPRPTDLILLGGFLWLAWSAGRYISWYGIVAMPILTQTLAHVVPPTGPRPPEISSSIRFALAAVLAVPFALVQPWSPWAGPTLTRTPVAATEYLRARPGGHLFNEVGFGSYLIWALPAQKVFVDPRFELFPFSQWVDYIELSSGRQVDELTARYGVDRVLLSRVLQPRLSEKLSASPAWMREYDDPEAEVWRLMTK